MNKDKDLHLFLFLCSCSVCETLFNSAMELEHHKEDLRHWSDAEDEVQCRLCYTLHSHPGNKKSKEDSFFAAVLAGLPYHFMAGKGFTVDSRHRLNMKLDLQSLFGLHVHSCTNWLRPSNSTSPRALGTYTRALLVSKD